MLFFGTAFNGRCRYDSVKVYEAKWEDNYELIGIYCGTKPPNSKNLMGKVKIEFVTDSNNNYGGFVINFRSTSKYQKLKVPLQIFFLYQISKPIFHLSECGGIVNRMSTISYYMTSNTGYADLYGECEWNIEAPPKKIIALRFVQNNYQYIFFLHQNSSFKGFIFELKTLNVKFAGEAGDLTKDGRVS